jgi:hypothetical protein
MLLSRSLRRLRRDDRGAALAAVIGLMATGLLLTALIGGAVVTAAGFTTSTRAGMQSQASAEAGIAAARAGLIAGTCGAQPLLANGAPVYVNPTGTDPVYEASIWRAGAGGTWTPGCPVDLTTQVRILSTGYAKSVGVASDASDSTNLEAVLSAPSTSSQIVKNGPAVYAYNAGAFGNGGQLVSLDGSTPDVIVANGSMTCGNGFAATANLVVDNGTLTVDNSCAISGNTWVSGRAEMINQGSIGGAVIADGVTMDNSASAGRVWSTDDLTMLSSTVSIGGQAKATQLNYSGGTIAGQTFVYGPLAIVKTTGNSSPFTGGAVAQSATVVPKTWPSSAVQIKNPVTPTFASDLPAKPVVPTWIDFGSLPEHYTSATWVGFTVVDMGTDCDSSQVIAKIALLGGAPGVLDGRNCIGEFKMSNSATANVYNDLAIIAPRIHFDGGNTALVGQSGPHDLWLINPDGATTAGAPDTNLCVNDGSYVKIENGPSFTDLTVMMYSPCPVLTVNNFTFTGQVFAGSSTLSNNTTLQYGAVGLPGYDLNTGAATNVTVVNESDRSVVYIRNTIEGN